MIFLSHSSVAEEWLSIDESVKYKFSQEAATLSDHLLAASYFFPIYGVIQTEASDLRIEVATHFILSELLNVGLYSGVKRWAGRMRPYTYNTSPAAVQLAAEDSKDHSRSFFSGHTSYTMVAARAFSQTLAPDLEAGQRQALLFAAFFNASSTAALRVAAGMHFYSDVFVGAVAALALCELTIQLQPDRSDFYKLVNEDYMAILLGVSTGFTWPLVLSFETETSEISWEPLISDQIRGLKFTLLW